MSNYFTENKGELLTPKLIKIFMIITLAFGFLSGLFNSLLGKTLHISFLNLFGLSLNGLKRGFIWQPLTFMFLPDTEASLTFYFLFTLSCDIYLLWLIGCRVHAYFGEKKTLKLFFIPAICASLAVALCSPFVDEARPIRGLSHSMIPLVVAYCFFNAQATFSFFSTLSIKLKWFGLGLILLYLFQDISNLNGTAFSSHLLLLIFSYIYMVIFQKLKSPFEFTHRIDQFFISRKQKKDSSKIIHLYETYESHEHFINQTLDKIGQGEKISLLDRLRLKLYRFRKRTRF